MPELRQLKDLLQGQGSKLARLASGAAARAQLTEQLRKQLPLPVCDHLVAANLRGDTLVLIADSAAWAARLRYHGTEILAELALTKSINLRKLTVKVRPA